MSIAKKKKAEAEADAVHLPALSIREPDASAIFAPDNSRKWSENRTWTTPYRGMIAIHRASYGGHQSAIIGVAELVDVQEIGENPGRRHQEFIAQAIKKYKLHADGAHHVYGPFAFVLRDARRFTRALPLAGRLGLFPVRVDIATGTAEHVRAGALDKAAPVQRRTVRRPRRTLTNSQILSMTDKELDRALFGEDRAS